ncbi:Ribonuclease H-like domain [Phytophthora cactorum]|nr:Ribonuclease H-like domain [Phytophthora cactorum]
MSFNNKSLTNKVVCTLIFTKKSRDEFVCSTCMKTCKNAHKAAKDRNALRLGVIDEETRTIFRWCKWVGNQPLLLRRAESERAHALLKMLTDFEGVTKTLQRSMLTLSGARCLFDLVCQRYTQLKPRLSPTADIVNYVALETGIVKLQWKEPLTAAERVACADFDVPIVERRRQTFIAVYVGAFQAFKKCKTSKRSLYDDVAFIPPTSNECERFFSSAKLVYSDLRKRLDPSTLEMLVFLMYDKDVWDVYTVESTSLISLRNIALHWVFLVHDLLLHGTSVSKAQHPLAMEFTFSHVLELLRPLPGFAKCWLWVIFHDQQVDLLSIEELFVATTGTGVVGNVIDGHVGLLNDDTFALPQGALLLLEIQGRNRAGNGNTSRVTVVFTQRLKQVRIGNQGA